MIPVLLGVLLGGLALWVLQPLRSRRAAAPHGATAVDGARWKELVDAKHALYRSILDLEFDRSVGKVSDEDYTFLRRQQEGEALDVLHQMDALAAGGGVAGGGSSPDTLEAEIAAARARLRPGASQGS